MEGVRRKSQAQERRQKGGRHLQRIGFVVFFWGLFLGGSSDAQRCGLKNLRERLFRRNDSSLSRKKSSASRFEVADRPLSAAARIGLVLIGRFLMVAHDAP